MQQTTYGEIHKEIKTEVFEKKKVDNFLEVDKHLYLKLKESGKCIYEESLSTTSDSVLNYLNTFPGTVCNGQLKQILRKEFDECEAIYPFLGDYLIDAFFDRKKSNVHKPFLLTSSTKQDFIDSLKFKEIKDIAVWFFKNASMKYSVVFKKTVGKNIEVVKENKLNFQVDYDCSYLGSKQFHSMKNYKFIIVDGQIESVSEIHHLLQQASETKVPHVIFCLGLSSEVENIIKFNNSSNKFEVFPVVIKFSEKTLNFLHDLSVALKEEVVSAKKGQTVSRKVRQELKEGKEIILSKSGFLINPSASDQEMLKHRSFLRNRIDDIVESETENKNLLIERLKAFASNLIKIHIPKELYGNNDFIRELDYCFRFLAKSNKKMINVTIVNKNIFIPSYIVEYANNKIKSLDLTYSNIGTLVVWDKNARN